VSEPRKRNFDPNATIQIDQIGGLDQVELIDEPAAPPANAAPERASRVTPPALPRSASVPASAPAPAQPRRSPLVYAVAIAIFVVAATGAGLLVGNRLRGATAAPAPSAEGTQQPPAPSASTLVLPTVEIGK
jgi:hypothetical protein